MKLSFAKDDFKTMTRKKANFIAQRQVNRR